MVEGSNPPSTNITVFISLLLVLFRFFIGFLFETQAYENHYSQLSNIRGAKFLVHPPIFLKYNTQYNNFNVLSSSQ